MKKRILLLLTALCLMLASFAPTAVAAQLRLEVLSYKFYPLQDLVFVDVMNTNQDPISNVVVDLVIREGTGRNRLIALGQVTLPPSLVLMPGEHISTRVPIRARIVRDIPALAQFEFRVTGAPVEREAAPPDVVVEGSDNGATLEFSRDQNGVPMVFAFVRLNEMAPAETRVMLNAAVLTFYDEHRQIVWSEYMPIGGRLGAGESRMIWGKYEQLHRSRVPNIDSIEVKFFVTGGAQ